MTADSLIGGPVLPTGSGSSSRQPGVGGVSYQSVDGKDGAGAGITSRNMPQVMQARAQQLELPAAQTGAAQNASSSTILSVFELAAAADGWYSVTLSLGPMTLTRRVYVDILPPRVAGHFIEAGDSLQYSQDNQPTPTTPPQAAAQQQAPPGSTIALLFALNFSEPVVMDLTSGGVELQGAEALRYSMAPDNASCSLRILAARGVPVRLTVGRDAYADLSGKRGANSWEVVVQQPEVGHPPLCLCLSRQLPVHACKDRCIAWRKASWPFNSSYNLRAVSQACTFGFPPNPPKPPYKPTSPHLCFCAVLMPA